jgi:hypothetical protein
MKIVEFVVEGTESSVRVGPDGVVEVDIELESSSEETILLRLRGENLEHMLWRLASEAIRLGLVSRGEVGLGAKV